MHCYLSELGNCSDKVTREHFISKNILEKIAAAQGEPNTKTHSLEVQNACDFFGGKPVTQIGINAFSAKVLCDNHNPALSAIDTAAGLAFETIERLTEDLIALDNGNELKSLYIASGLDIERWMVKVFCGLSAAGKIRGRSGNSLKKGAPQTTFLECLLNGAALPFPLGLYMHTYIGQLRSRSLSFSTIQLTDGSDDVGGLMLSLGLMNFVLVTSPDYGQVFRDDSWYYHQALSWNVRKGRSRISYLFTY